MSRCIQELLGRLLLSYFCPHLKLFVLPPQGAGMLSLLSTGAVICICTQQLLRLDVAQTKKVECRVPVEGRIILIYTCQFQADTLNSNFQIFLICCDTVHSSPPNVLIFHLKSAFCWPSFDRICELYHLPLKSGICKVTLIALSGSLKHCS